MWHVSGQWTSKVYWLIGAKWAKNGLFVCPNLYIRFLWLFTWKYRVYIGQEKADNPGKTRIFLKSQGKPERNLEEKLESQGEGREF